MCQALKLGVPQTLQIYTVSQQICTPLNSWLMKLDIFYLKLLFNINLIIISALELTVEWQS
jgi:hypothetical protein